MRKTLIMLVHKLLIILLSGVGEKGVTFSQVVLEVLRHLEGAYALIFKSVHYPNELIACKRGSPLLIGVKVSRLRLCGRICLIIISIT